MVGLYFFCSNIGRGAIQKKSCVPYKDKFRLKGDFCVEKSVCNVWKVRKCLDILLYFWDMCEILREDLTYNKKITTKSYIHKTKPKTKNINAALFYHKSAKITTSKQQNCAIHIKK